MKNAANVVDMLIEAEIVRVCMFCEKERGPVPIQPGQSKSHGVCRRHIPAFVNYSAQGLPADYQQKMIATMQQKPDTDFAPDLSQAMPESLEDRACMSCAREQGTLHDRSYGQCKRHWLEWAKSQGFTDDQIAEVIQTIEAGQGWAPDLSQPVS